MPTITRHTDTVTIVTFDTVDQFGDAASGKIQVRADGTLKLFLDNMPHGAGSYGETVTWNWAHWTLCDEADATAAAELGIAHRRSQ